VQLTDTDDREPRDTLPNVSEGEKGAEEAPVPELVDKGKRV